MNKQTIYIYTMNIIWEQKEVKYCYMLQLEWTLKTSCQVKKARHTKNVYYESIYIKFPE